MLRIPRGHVPLWLPRCEERGVSRILDRQDARDQRGVPAIPERRSRLSRFPSPAKLGHSRTPGTRKGAHIRRTKRITPWSW